MNLLVAAQECNETVAWPEVAFTAVVAAALVAGLWVLLRWL